MKRRKKKEKNKTEKNKKEEKKEAKKAKEGKKKECTEQTNSLQDFLGKIFTKKNAARAGKKSARKRNAMKKQTRWKILNKRIFKKKTTLPARAKNQPKNGNGARPLCIKFFGVHACAAGQSFAPQGKILKIGVFFRGNPLGKMSFGRDRGRQKPGFWGTFS